MQKLNLLLCFLFMLLSHACKKQSTDLSDVEVLSIRMNNPTKENEASSFIEKIEISPLETSDSCLIRSFRKLSYCEDLDAYIILDRNMIVYIFSNEGQFISSSSLSTGEGPEQYLTITDFNYNPYTGTVDLLDPYGTLYCYDLDFKLSRKKSLNNKDFVFQNLFPIDKDKYLLARSLIAEHRTALFLVDYANETMEEISNHESLSTNHMMREPFFQLNDGFYFSPCYLDYYFYHINIENKVLNPVIKLDFGTGNVTKEHLIEKFGKLSSGEKSKNNSLKDVKRKGDISAYLTESNYPLPIVKFLNDEYVYSYIIVNRTPSNYIYNRKTKQSFFQSGKSPIPMPFFVGINNNILYTLVDPYDAEKYVSEYMSEDVLNRIKQLKEDDNPIVMKYYLK